VTWIDAYATPILDSDMNLVGVSTAFVNITELRLALAREKETKQYYERLSSEASDIVLTLGANGEVLTASASAEALFGLPMETILGSALESLLPADAEDTVRTLISNVSAVASGSGRVVVQMQSPVAGLRAYDLALKNLMNDPVSQFLICTFRDVDQLFNLQADLTEANAELSRTITELERAASIDGYLADALDLLVRCQNLTELGEVIWDCVNRIFIDSNIALYLVESGGTELRLFRQAGTEFEHTSVLAEKCWGIRTRHVHLNAHNGVRCEHFVPEKCSVCLPFFFESRLVAWAQIERDGEDCETLEKSADKIFRRLLPSIPPETLEVVLPS
jgi:PAS domain-containing protein